MKGATVQAGTPLNPWDYHCAAFNHAWRRFVDDVPRLTPDLLYRHRLTLEATLGLAASDDDEYRSDLERIINDTAIDERAKKWAARIRTRVWQDRADFERDMKIVAAIGRSAERNNLWGRVRRKTTREDPRVFAGNNREVEP